MKSHEICSNLTKCAGLDDIKGPPVFNLNLSEVLLRADAKVCNGRRIDLQVEGVAKISQNYMDVSKNRGIPKWMVYNRKPY